MTDDEPTYADVEKTAYRLLARRGHARGELEKKLRRRDYPDELIREVVDDCVQAGYVDDEQFALRQGEMLARKSWGPHQIRNKLRGRGVDDTVIDAALTELSDQFDWSDTARTRLESKFGSPDELDDRTRQKAYRHLMHRGFSSSMIRRLLFD